MKKISIPYEDYFGDMDLDKKDIQKRISLAEKLEDAFSLFLELYKDGNIDKVTIRNQLREDVTKAISHDMILDDYLFEFIDELIANIYDVTEKKVSEFDNLNVLSSKLTQGTLFSESNLIENETNDKINDRNDKNDFLLWFLSVDRAIALAENNSNSIWNYDEYRTAIENGMTQKTWHTERDKSVRPTHREVESETIPINDVFYVGNSMLMFPKDTSLGASMDEISNCRCTITYS